MASIFKMGFFFAITYLLAFNFISFAQEEERQGMLLAGYGDNCSVSAECEPSLFLKCDLQYGADQLGTCRCKDGTTRLRDACIAQAKSSCEIAPLPTPVSPTKCVPNSKCSATTSVCECDSGFNATQNPKLPTSRDLICIGSYEAECDPDETTCEANLQCLDSSSLQSSSGQNSEIFEDTTTEPPASTQRTIYKCLCQNYDYQVWDIVKRKCLTLVTNGFNPIRCSLDDDCVSNAICSSGSCTCASSTDYGVSFERNSDGQCLPTHNQPCTNTCNDIQGLICTNNACQCPPGKTYEPALSSEGIFGICATTINGVCNVTGSAFARACAGGSACHRNNQCLCDRSQKYVEDTGTNKCVQMNGALGEYCLTNDDCHSTEFLSCTNNGTTTPGRCICEQDMIPVVTGSWPKCQTLAGKSCTRNHDCVDDGACIDGICVCRRDRVRASDGRCYLSYGQSCGAASLCNAEQGLICDRGSCECPTGQIWSTEHSQCVALVSGDCSATINNLCTANATCSDDRKVCECNPGFTAHSLPPDTSLHYHDGYRTCMLTFNETCDPKSTTEFCNDEEFLVCDKEANQCVCEYPLQQEWDESSNQCVSLFGGYCGTLPEINHYRVMNCIESTVCRNESDVLSKCTCDFSLGYNVTDDGRCELDRRSAGVRNFNSNMMGLNILFFAALVSLFVGTF